MLSNQELELFEPSRCIRKAYNWELYLLEKAYNWEWTLSEGKIPRPSWNQPLTSVGATDDLSWAEKSVQLSFLTMAASSPADGLLSPVARSGDHRL